MRVVEGVIVRLICRVNRGFPTPQVTWYLNDRLIMPSERFLINTRPIDSLTVNGIQLQDTGQVSCVAVNTAGQARESSFIRILGKDKLASFVEASNVINDTKVLKVIHFGSKCTKGPKCNTVLALNVIKVLNVIRFGPKCNKILTVVE